MGRMENIMHLQTVRSSRSVIHSGHGLFMTGPHAAISIKKSIKEGSREKKEVRNKRLDGEGWSVFLAGYSRELCWISFYSLCMCQASVNSGGGLLSYAEPFLMLSLVSRK